MIFIKNRGNKKIFQENSASSQFKLKLIFSFDFEPGNENYFFGLGRRGKLNYGECGNYFSIWMINQGKIGRDEGVNGVARIYSKANEFR